LVDATAEVMSAAGLESLADELLMGLAEMERARVRNEVRVRSLYILRVLGLFVGTKSVVVR
jgi:hypothetical protein